MGVFDQGYEQALIDAGRQPVERPSAGLLETFLAVTESERQEHLSISETLNLDRHRQTRREKIKELTGEDIYFLEREAVMALWVRPGGRLPRERATVERYRATLQDLASRYPEIRTDEDMLADISDESRRIRERTEKVLGNTTFAGKLGSFAGAMAAAMTDPLVLASMAFGASASAAILRTALTEAGIGVLSEAMIQPFVWRYKKKLESPYDLGEALTRVGAAGAGTFLLAGTIKGAARGIGKLRKPKIEGLDDLLDEYLAKSSIIEAKGEYYHGDSATGLSKIPAGSGNLGKGVYLTRSVDEARYYAAGWAGGVSAEDFAAVTPANIYKIRIKQGKLLKTPYPDVPEEQLLSIKKAGYIGVETPYETLIFDPDNVEVIGTLSRFASAAERDAAHVLGDYADTLRENPFELGDPAADMRHMEATSKAMSDVEAGRPVDVREIVGDLAPREELRGEPTFVREGPVTPKRGPGIEEPTQTKPLLEPGGGKQPYDMSREEFDRTGLEVGSNLKERWTRVVYAADENRLPNLRDHFPEDRQTKLIRETPEQVTVYRAVPDVAEGIRPGDWVALDRKYAAGHLEGRKRGKIITQKITSDEVVWAGTDENEFFYAPKKFSRPQAVTTYDALQELTTRPSPSTPPIGGGEVPSPTTRALTDPTFERLASAKEPEVLIEIDGRARAILEEGDLEISMVARAEEGELVPLAGREAAEAVEKGEATIVTRSAKEFIEEADADAKAGDILTKCLLGG